ncbi:Pre-mRNA-splicing factor cwc22 [Glycine soja]|uniref:Pre-mRNA-splicing factor cwc22 n=1 Tax=Glycine soja TaxID=3848 RepID=A0A0B2S3H4_GLYSO|nr:Pre-mRNA-splicing factor cwc22 [Glycine soja]
MSKINKFIEVHLKQRRENSDGNRDRKQEDGNRRMVEDANTQGHATILGENLIRGRELLYCRSCMKLQTASLRDLPMFLLPLTPSFLKWGIFSSDSRKIIALELLTVLLEKPIDDSVEVAVGFVTDCVSILRDLSPKGLHGIFEKKRYKELKKSMLGEESEDDDEEGLDADESDNDNEEEEEHMQIKDEMETNLVNLRKTKYSAIMSSVDLEEAGHKLLEIKLEPGQEMELCIMILECCRQEKNLSLILESSRAVFADNMPCLIMQQQKDESGSSDSSDSDAESASSDQSDTENDRSGRKQLEDKG